MISVESVRRSLANTIPKISSDQDLAELLVNGRKIAEAKYNWLVVTDGMERV